MPRAAPLRRPSDTISAPRWHWLPDPVSASTKWWPRSAPAGWARSTARKTGGSEAKTLATLNHPHIARIYGLTADGGVKVLDFGLAKPTETGAASLLATHSPTLTSPALTTRGVVLGPSHQTVGVSS